MFQFLSANYFLLGLQQSLLLSLIALGAFLTFKLLKLPDFTVQGSYPFAASMYYVLLLNQVPLLIAMLIAVTLAGLIGVCTATIHLRLKLNPLLAGIIVSYIVSSLNLHLLGGSNVSLLAYPSWLSSLSLCVKVVWLVVINGVCLIGLKYLLLSEIGLRLRAVGFNTIYASRYRINVPLYTMFGLFLSNALYGLSAVLMAQMQRYVDINMGNGVVMNAFAATILAEALFPSRFTLFLPIIGAICYQQLQGFALLMGLPPYDLKLFVGMMLLVIIFVKQQMTLKL